MEEIVDYISKKDIYFVDKNGNILDGSCCFLKDKIYHLTISKCRVYENFDRIGFFIDESNSRHNVNYEFVNENFTKAWKK